MNKRAIKLTKYSIITISLPLIIEFLLTNLLGSVDTLMIANYSSNAPGSIANANTVVGLLLTILVILSVGANVTISAFLGANRKDKAQETLISCLIVNLFTGLIIFTFLMLAAPSLFKLINTPTELIDGSIVYLRIYVIAVPFLALDFVLKAYLRANSKTPYLLGISIIANLLNILFNYLLIYGVGNIPALGIKGAAISTVISILVGFILKLILIRFKLKTRFVPLKINPQIIKLVTKLGAPSAFENFSYMISTFFVLAACNTLGTTSVLARTYIATITNLINQISLGLGIGNQTIVSYNVGTGNDEEIIKSTYRSFLLACPILLIFVVIINIFTYQIFGIFTNDINVLTEIKRVVPILFAFIIGQSMAHIYIAALKGLSDIYNHLIISLISSFLVCSLGAWFFGVWINLCLIGIFIATSLDELVRGSAALIRFASKKWVSYSQKERNIIKTIN